MSGFAFEDLDVFFKDAPEILIGPVGEELPIRAWFDAAHYAVDDATSTVSITRPMITCKSSDVVEIVQGDGVYHDDVEYRVMDTRHDGTGICEIDLQKVGKL
jgi:hypothetical protein